jgi:hypothetical protein
MRIPGSPTFVPAKLREGFLLQKKCHPNFLPNCGKEFLKEIFFFFRKRNLAGTNVGEPGILIMSVELACGIVLGEPTINYKTRKQV